MTKQSLFVSSGGQNSLYFFRFFSFIFFFLIYIYFFFIFPIESAGPLMFRFSFSCCYFFNRTRIFKKKQIYKVCDCQANALMCQEFDMKAGCRNHKLGTKLITELVKFAFKGGHWQCNRSTLSDLTWPPALRRPLPDFRGKGGPGVWGVPFMAPGQICIYRQEVSGGCRVSLKSNCPLKRANWLLDSPICPLCWLSSSAFLSRVSLFRVVCR